jgi:hypothetical protein
MSFGVAMMADGRWSRGSGRGLPDTQIGRACNEVDTLRQKTVGSSQVAAQGVASW